MIDYQGISILITSTAAATVSVVTLVRQGKNKAEIDVKLQELHAQGNSNLETARVLAEKLGVERGKVMGAEAERANPLQEAPR